MQIDTSPPPSLPSPPRRPSRPLLRLAAAALAIAAATVQAAPGDAAQPVREATDNPVDRTGRMCFAGLEDGKIIVPPLRLSDEATQTTPLQCRINGGVEERAPRSPTLRSGGTLLA